MKCVKCGKKIDDDSVFCGYCGVNQLKFIKYIESVDKEIHKERDKNYDVNIKEAQKKLKELNMAKEKEISRISNARWQSIGNMFSYNVTEGEVKINDTYALFSSINGAEINVENSYRVITTNNGGSTKHASLGGAVAGGLLLGPVGAVVGGSALGKTTSTGSSSSNSIPTCNHIGVIIDVDGFKSEIILLNKTVDQSSSDYNNAIFQAQSIVNKCRDLSKMPVPKIFKKPNEEDSVLAFDNQIEKAANDLNKIYKDKPTYEVPEKYYK